MSQGNNLKKKQTIVEEIKSKIEENSSLVLFNYRGISDEEAKEIRKNLKEESANYKVYKNTLMQKAFSELGYNLDEELKGPSALAFSTDQLAPIKVLSTFAKKNKHLELKAAIIDKEITDKGKIAKLATIPSRDGLLTMLAMSLMAIPRDLAISLDLLSKEKAESKN